MDNYYLKDTSTINVLPNERLGYSFDEYDNTNDNEENNENGWWPNPDDPEPEPIPENRNFLSVDGDTLTVGRDYNHDIWLNNLVSGAFSQVRVIDAESDDNTNDLFITGNRQVNSIVSGDGQTTLWGAGGGQNTIKGDASRNYFWYEGNSKDVAINFGVGDYSYSDVVVLAGGATYSSINRDNASITFYMADGNYMQIQPNGKSYDDDPIWFSGNGTEILRFKIAKNTSTSLNYRNDVNTFYFSQPSQIMVSGSNNNIWLAGDNGQNYVNVSTINAGASSGYNTLMGNSDSNVIIGGSGASTLWGYYGNADDTLIGGSGPEIFRVGKYEGNDFIYTNGQNDVIFLYDTNLSDIDYANIDGDRITVGFNTGSQMTLVNTSNVTSVFQTADGARYNYNRNTGRWQGA